MKEVTSTRQIKNKPLQRLDNNSTGGGTGGGTTGTAADIFPDNYWALNALSVNGNKIVTYNGAPTSIPLTQEDW